MTMTFKRWMGLAWLCLVPLCGNAVTPVINAGAIGSIFLNSDGSVWGAGQVVGYSPGSTSPVRLLRLSNLVTVTTNSAAAYALLGDGTVWASGDNNRGQLGDGTTEPHFDTRQVPGLIGITDIQSGGHVLALKTDGTVWAWGQNDQGQLGDGTRLDRYSLLQVSGLLNVVQISASASASLALKSDGTVWVWGPTCCGNAGNGLVPSTAIDPETNHLVPSEVLNLDRVVTISSGTEHNLALRADGTVWTWGRGYEGQNGNGSLVSSQLLPVQVPGLSDVVAIDARGWRFSVVLKTDGSVWAWGINNAGQLGVSGIALSAVPIQVPGLSDITAIAAGSNHVVAMRRDASVFAWGGNSNGQLGDGTLQNRADPRPVLGPGGSGALNLLQPPPPNPNQLPSVQVDSGQTSGSAPLTVTFDARNSIDPDGTIRAYYWQASDGQQATGPSVTFVFSRPGAYTVTVLVEDNAGGRGNASVQVVVTTPQGSVAASPKIDSRSSSIALASNGRILGWGPADWIAFSQHRPVGQPISVPIAIGVTGAIDFVQGGSGFALVLLADGTVLGCGGNDQGQLGVGSQASGFLQPQSLTNLPPVQALAAGVDHALALTRDGRVFAWGRNAEGQLGLGDNQNRFDPVEIAGLSNIIAIAAGLQFSMALAAGGTVWTWGENTTYHLGDGTQLPRNRPVQVPGLVNVQRIFATWFNGIAINADGIVWASGLLPFSFAGDANPPLVFRRVPLLDGAVQLAGGDRHFIFRKADGTVWVVGMRISLALGVGGTDDIHVPQQVPGITDAIWVAASANNSVVVRRDGTVLAWGLNPNGQLGDGTLAYRPTPVLAVNETADDALDLVSEVPNTISPELMPLFYVVTTKSGALDSTSLSVDVKGPAIRPQGRFAAGYNVYVAASVPTTGGPLFFQLDSSKTWGSLRWPMAEFMRGVALDSQNSVVTADILQNTDLRNLIGSTIYVGYRLDADEMVSHNRYRDIFTVAQPQ